MEGKLLRRPETAATIIVNIVVEFCFLSNKYAVVDKKAVFIHYDAI